MFLILRSVKIGIDLKETKFETNQTWGPRLIDERMRTKLLSHSNRGVDFEFSENQPNENGRHSLYKLKVLEDLVKTI
ncbi:hypothetical protein [Leptospira noguchii]|uniref:Uncharacterized protein n=3 Tax=Leptospira noguchii TaxID=28182 RepID=M6UJ59_9LEPT|nr:hypothetical protein [Leptospira noguchii]EMO29004.1 hypothetical protein LEP1GSC170_2600 [Leptospira interrogans serovar Bataviae str. HAI135]EKR71316.1 hypothetical protein LEP1GSC041_1669 [Leptospira noguchii str. 2006001870]EMI64589.1 hypothetical protein LEP1GSC072_2953 [Leptospira noguchii str. Bonito]EMN00286.1 hypothetical protein LEP1GSC035_4637 [Leptospira noguchii str. 2007001578]EMO42856.1 hypothetical protein LEP1GSC186_1507 [Leptospira noguchii serovar Autumnalis str. ZUN142]